MVDIISVEEITTQTIVPSSLSELMGDDMETFSALQSISEDNPSPTPTPPPPTPPHPTPPPPHPSSQRDSNVEFNVFIIINLKKLLIK